MNRKTQEEIDQENNDKFWDFINNVVFKPSQEGSPSIFDAFEDKPLKRHLVLIQGGKDS